MSPNSLKIVVHKTYFNLAMETACLILFVHSLSRPTPPRYGLIRYREYINRIAWDSVVLMAFHRSEDCSVSQACIYNNNLTHNIYSHRNNYCFATPWISYTRKQNETKQLWRNTRETTSLTRAEFNFCHKFTLRIGKPLEVFEKIALVWISNIATSEITPLANFQGQLTASRYVVYCDLSSCQTTASTWREGRY